MKTLYDEFRLCVTTAHLGGRKGIGLSPYPYAVGVTSFACEIYHSYQKGLYNEQGCRTGHRYILRPHR